MEGPFCRRIDMRVAALSAVRLRTRVEQAALTEPTHKPAPVEAVLLSLLRVPTDVGPLTFNEGAIGHAAEHLRIAAVLTVTRRRQASKK
jgi:hypothetical protein